MRFIGLPVLCFAALLLLMSMPRNCRAEDAAGVYGRAAWRGELVPGVVVWAYRDGKSGYLTGEVARSEPTATDGTYRLPLEPGRYTFVAREYKGGGDGRPSSGDYYCYYSGSPVVVPRGGWVPVGFNLVKYLPEVREKAERSTIKGSVTYRGEPLEKLYLYLYKDASDGFRGPGISTLPVGSGGRFRVSVTPGEYFIIARKRARGGMYGPVDIGDYFNYYPGNPVVVGEGESVRLSIETVTRISQLDEGGSALPMVEGRIVDGNGNPIEGVRVFAYRPEKVKGRPIFFSDPSGPNGRFSLPIPEVGAYSLVARQRFGGPAASDEYHGLYKDGAAVMVGVSGPGEEIILTVGKGP
ncbi:MAG: carboxypeptidase regulatory-like domain-containing protein [Deltaproteobacteria bacterium]|nr:carboxypeptidase regulatory-like domain-containing protein [Deltaproteobacteria bacterium]